MACFVKIVLAFVIVQVAVVLATPYERENDDGLYHSLSDTVKRAESCNFVAKDREDCGFGEISEKDCKSKGCCWDSSVSKAPWCFKPADCGSGTEVGGLKCSQRCRSSCRKGEQNVAEFDSRCFGNDICCREYNALSWWCRLDI